MATNILSTASTAADSADQTFTAETLVSLKGVAHGARVVVHLKDDGAGYNVVAELTHMKASGVLPAGTYRFTRVAGAACGVFSA